MKADYFRVYVRQEIVTRGSLTVEAGSAREAIEKARERLASMTASELDDTDHEGGEFSIFAMDRHLDGGQVMDSWELDEISGEVFSIEEAEREFEEINDDLPEPGDIRETGK
jgi:hypothetical protein